MALSYAPPARRTALSLLWQLDERMSAIVAATHEPAIGAMRLIWWRDALTALDDPDARPPAEPLLAGIQAQLIASGLPGKDLASLEEGWSTLLDAEEPGESEITAHGELRGEPLFTLAAKLLGGQSEDVARAGAGWALADLGHRLRQEDARRFARARAAEKLSGVDPVRWPKPLRPLGLLVLLARHDAAMPAQQMRRQGAPMRLMRGLAYRLTGR